MNNKLIGILVAAVILFVWQFLSWSVLMLHDGEIAYSGKQDQVLAALAELELEEGHYYMPRAAASASMDEVDAVLEQALGNPWAMVSYHHSMEFSYSESFLRGFVTDVAAAALLVWILSQFAGLNMRTAILASISIGLTGFLTITYLNTIWLELPAAAHLIDAIVAWGLTGLWLGWWLPRAQTGS